MGALETEHPVRARFRTDFPFFSQHCLTIKPKVGHPVNFRLKAEQLRFYEALQAQEAEGRPKRAIILKARQLGFSTLIQGLLIHRVTQQPPHRGFVLAQDRRTAGSLFDMGVRMWESIPGPEHDPPAPEDLRPRKRYGRRQQSLELDNGSVYQADGAREFEAGRGLTVDSLHVSELAFYPDAQRKLTGLLQTVPDEPGTLVVFESTANGQNYFKELWDAAEAGESDYLPFFSPWFHEPGYRRLFANEAEREEFAETVGMGPLGEDEPGLLDLGLDLEQLHWRRWTIRNKAAGDLDRFHQEYPSTPLEAFIATGRHVFQVAFIRSAQKAAEDAREPDLGTLSPVASVKRPGRGAVTLDVPTSVSFEPKARLDDDRAPGWKIWEHPQAKTDESPAGQYIIGVDASGGEERNGATAYHVIQVINHRTREQAAEYRSQIDPDLLALEVFMACLYWNRPWAAIEITGSWGGPAVRRLKHDYRYPFVYRRKALDKTRDRDDDRLGWDTNWVTKHHLEETAGKLLREGLHGIRSRGLASELAWYVRDNRNRSGPEPGKWSDRLMAWMIAQHVAAEKPLKSDRPRGQVSTTVDHLQLGRAGYLT